MKISEQKWWSFWAELLLTWRWMKRLTLSSEWGEWWGTSINKSSVCLREIHWEMTSGDGWGLLLCVKKKGSALLKTWPKRTGGPDRQCGQKLPLFTCSVFQLKTDISFNSFNKRELKDSQANCIFLQKTHSDESDVKFWSQHGEIKSSSVMVPTVWLELLFVSTDVLLRCCVTGWIKMDNGPLVFWTLITFWLFTIYGYNNVSKNKNLLNQISTVIRELNTKLTTDHMVVGGDFNVTPDDRWPPNLSREYRNPIMENFTNNNKLIDIWRTLNTDVRQFIWHKPDGQIRSCIDYWLVSNSISEYVTETTISNCHLSDHCTINLN